MNERVGRCRSARRNFGLHVYLAPEIADSTKSLQRTAAMVSCRIRALISPEPLPSASSPPSMSSPAKNPETVEGTQAHPPLLDAWQLWKRQAYGLHDHRKLKLAQSDCKLRPSRGNPYRSRDLAVSQGQGSFVSPRNPFRLTLGSSAEREFDLRNQERSRSERRRNITEGDTPK